MELLSFSRNERNIEGSESNEFRIILRSFFQLLFIRYNLYPLFDIISIPFIGIPSIDKLVWIFNFVPRLIVVVTTLTISG